METEEDLDALLSEIRDLLADSPVPKLDPEQLKNRRSLCRKFPFRTRLRFPGGAPAADAAPAPTPAESPAQAEPAPEIPTVEEPTIPIGEIPLRRSGRTPARRRRSRCLRRFLTNSPPR